MSQKRSSLMEVASRADCEAPYYAVFAVFIFLDTILNDYISRVMNLMKNEHIYRKDKYVNGINESMIQFFQLIN
jgi:hypothetical protein